MEPSLVSAAVLMLLVIDPFGSIPLFTIALKGVAAEHRMHVILRECLIAALVLFVFLIFGQPIMSVLQLSQTSLGIAGGIILFLVALRIIFPPPEGLFGAVPGGEPFIFPLAVPLISGPSAIAVVMLLVARWPEHLANWILALIIATAISTVVLAAGDRLTRWLGERGIMALERLMGLVLTALAVEMFLSGLRDFIHTI